MGKVFIFLALSIIIGCSPNATIQTSSVAYNEDLSQYRPKVKPAEITKPSEENSDSDQVPFVKPTNHINAELDSVLAIKAAKNLEVGFVQGYTIQIYSGRSREEANNAKLKAFEVLEEVDADVYYDQPMFRVKVGQYFSRLQAEKDYGVLKNDFPQALVLPDRIRLEND
ncbi:MAG: SPOR domain-containing protein [Cyclobacteriaceae bacterium]